VATQLTVAGQPVRWLGPAGQGVTSSVWLGESEGVACVLKLGRTAGEAPRFADEAERLLFAAAPEFPQLLGLGFAGPALGAELGVRLEPGTPYLLLSSAPGVSLERREAELGGDEGAREALALVVARDVGAALAALHASNAAHGDVKPANIIVAESRARLVDFGLSGAAQQIVPTGGTRRYLAPEVFRSGDGDARARDLWALGVTLLELLEPASREMTPLDFVWSAHTELSAIVRALLTKAPGARPSAAWVVRRARALAGDENAENAAISRRAAIERSYLNTRRDEIFQAVRRGGVRIEVTGPGRAWLTHACELAQGIVKLRGLTPEPEPIAPIAALTDSGRARFLVSLVGPAAASWPIAEGTSEAAWLERLLGLAETSEPESFTLAAIERGVTPAPIASHAGAVEIALALGAPHPDPAWLDRGETVVRRDHGPLGFALALARAFRLRGELGRALQLRHAPKLEFVYDQQIETADKLTRLIDGAVKSDQRKPD